MKKLLVAVAILGLVSATSFAGDSANPNQSQNPEQANPNQPVNPPVPPAPEDTDHCDLNGDGDSICSAVHDVAKAAWWGVKSLGVHCVMDYRMDKVGILVIGGGAGEASITCTTPTNPEPKTSYFTAGELLEINVGPQLGYYSEEGKIYFAGVGFGREADLFAMLSVNVAAVMGTDGFSVGLGAAAFAGVDADGVSANVALAAKIADKVEGMYLGANIALTAGAVWTPWTHGDE